MSAQLDSASNGWRIAEIDGLRGVSILLVVLGHLLAWRYAAYFPVSVLQIGAFMSQLGVMTFFMISGFVITRLSVAEGQRGEFSVRRFYLRRAIRILPALFCYLVTILLLTFAGLVNQSGGGVAKAGIFTCNFFDDCGWFVGHTWTLAYEWQFYLLFPVLLLFGLRCRVVLVLLTLGSILGVVFGWLPDQGKSIAFIAAGCLIAYGSKALAPVGETNLVLSLRSLARLSVFQFFGKISYSLYLWQQLFTASPSNYLTSSVLDFPLLALLIACFSYHFLEKVGGLWLRQKFCLFLEPAVPIAQSLSMSKAVGGFER